MRLAVAARLARAGGFLLDVDERVDAEALGIVGPSGSGKSTLLDAIAGYEQARRVMLDGTDLAGLPPDKRRLGYVGQEALLFPHLSVRANLLYSPNARSLQDVPEALGIERLLDRMPRNLSGGERRRVALGRAILSRPRLLLLDEPFGGLDENRRREAMALLERLRSRYGLPMILVSHVADEVVGLTDVTIRLEAGRVVARGGSAAILERGETRVDNHLEGDVIGPGLVRVGVTAIAAPLPSGAAGRVRLSCYAHDILLSRARPDAISARNVLPVRVRSKIATHGGVLVELGDPRLLAIVTAEADRALDLEPGREVFAIVKATSIAYLGPV